MSNIQMITIKTRDGGREIDAEVIQGTFGIHGTVENFGQGIELNGEIYTVTDMGSGYLMPGYFISQFHARHYVTAVIEALELTGLSMPTVVTEAEKSGDFWRNEGAELARLIRAARDKHGYHTLFDANDALWEADRF